jgi:Zn ribbon nucleic-acid-binding protein
MSESNPSKRNYRCPWCLKRESEVWLLRNDKDIYRCIRCCFRGTESDIFSEYEELKPHVRKKRKAEV